MPGCFTDNDIVPSRPLWAFVYELSTPLCNPQKQFTRLRPATVVLITLADSMMGTTGSTKSDLTTAETKQPASTPTSSYTVRLRTLARVHDGSLTPSEVVNFHSITAVGCGHHLYSLPRLIRGDAVDYTILLCPSCENDMRQELVFARANHDVRWQDLALRRNKNYYRACARFNHAVRAVANFENYNAETEEMQGMIIPKTGKGKRVRFAEDGYRPEDEYRSASCYRRGSPKYQPGRHADLSGAGFVDTSICTGLAERETPTTIEQTDPEDSTTICRII